MQYLCMSHLEKAYENQVWLLLKETDYEFIPPLSSRNGTQDKKFEIECINEEGPISYFEHMKFQNFILAIEDDVVGFLSYIPNHHICLEDDKEELCEYVSTIAVNLAYRNHKIAQELYQKLLDKCRLPIVTRTWSTNIAHIHILRSLGFKMVKIIKDDRGKGIHTIYYKKF